MLLADRGSNGDVYNLGTMRAASVLSYLLLSIEKAGFPVLGIEAACGGKKVEHPLEPDHSALFGIPFEKTVLDRMLLDGTVSYSLEDGGIQVRSEVCTIPVMFDPARFRTAEVPILLADTTKAREIGFSSTCTLEDIIRDQLDNTTGRIAPG
jgi:GDPmannose 4,6-dehydratase